MFVAVWLFQSGFKQPTMKFQPVIDEAHTVNTGVATAADRRDRNDRCYTEIHLSTSYKTKRFATLKSLQPR
jgi:hypothetical protein